MKLSEAYWTGKRKLTEAGVENAGFDASCLFFHCFGIRRHRLPVCGEEEAEASALERYFSLLSERASGEPLQYLLGEWEFMGLPFFVGRGVLIPRDDTEALVRSCAGCLGQKEAPKLLDLCAGSGAVGIALSLLYYPKGEVRALELSEEAFFYLQKNIARSRARVYPFLRDVLLGPNEGELSCFDAIVSNPPYILSEKLPSLQREVQREPALALDGGEDGLLFYRAFAEKWVAALKPGGILAVEIGIGQGDAVKKLWKKAGLEQIETERDLSGIERTVFGRKPLSR